MQKVDRTDQTKKKAMYGKHQCIYLYIDITSIPLSESLHKKHRSFVSMSITKEETFKNTLILYNVHSEINFIVYRPVL